MTNGGKRDDDKAIAGKDWKVVIADEYARRSGVYAAPVETSFPLIASSIFSEEILAAVDSMLNGQLTMANNVRDFERAFAKYVGAPFAVMCNSGSSANLLALAALTNHMRSKKLSVGDEVLIPAVCWSKSKNCTSQNFRTSRRIYRRTCSREIHTCLRREASRARCKSL